MEEKNKKEKKALKLRLKTFADLKRFTSKQLHKIVEKFREKNKDLKDLSLEEILENEKWTKAMGAVIRQSLINRSDKKREQRTDAINEKREDLKKDIEQYTKDVEEGKLVGKEKQKAYNKLNDRAYKIDKEVYTRDLGPADQEKPKNPMIQRAVKNVAKAAKTVGKGIATGAGIAASVVAFPFVMAYKGARAVGRGIKALGKGAQVAALTAGKVAGNVKDQVQTANGEVHREMYEKASEEKKQKMMEDAYKEADKENAKREREAARREKLHMNAERQPIDHEEAMKRTADKIDEQELTQEEK